MTLNRIGGSGIMIVQPLGVPTSVARICTNYCAISPQPVYQSKDMDPSYGVVLVGSTPDHVSWHFVATEHTHLKSEL